WARKPFRVLAERMHEVVVGLSAVHYLVAVSSVWEPLSQIQAAECFGQPSGNHVLGLYPHLSKFAAFIHGRKQHVGRGSSVWRVMKYHVKARLAVFSCELGQKATACWRAPQSILDVHSMAIK